MVGAANGFLDRKSITSFTGRSHARVLVIVVHGSTDTDRDVGEVGAVLEIAEASHGFSKHRFTILAIAEASHGFSDTDRDVGEIGAILSITEASLGFSDKDRDDNSTSLVFTDTRWH